MARRRQRKVQPIICMIYCQIVTIIKSAINHLLSYERIIVIEANVLERAAVVFVMLSLPSWT
jgi:hypothetical protein